MQYNNVEIEISQMITFQLAHLVIQQSITILKMGLWHCLVTNQYSYFTSLPFNVDMEGVEN